MKLSGPQFLKKKQNYRYFQGEIVHMQPQWFFQTAGRRKQIDLIQLRLMEEILHQLRLVVYPIIYKVLYIPGG